MNIKQILQQGAFPFRSVEPQEPQHCWNCGADFEGAYCPRCGQYWQVQRITAKKAMKSFVTNTLGLQANLPRTLIDLFYRPGYLVSDYLSGKRKHYSNPFSTILLLATIFVCLNQYVMDGELIEMTTSYSSEVNDEVNQLLGVSSYETATTKQISAEVARTIYEFFGLFNLLLVPLITLPFWLVFRKEGVYKAAPLNLAEAMTAMAFVGCQNMMVSILTLPFTTPRSFGTVTLMGYLLMFFLFLLTLWQLLHIRLWRFLWRNLLLALFVLLLVFLTTIVSGTIVTLLQMS